MTRKELKKKAVQNKDRAIYLSQDYGDSPASYLKRLNKRLRRLKHA